MEPWSDDGKAFIAKLKPLTVVLSVYVLWGAFIYYVARPFVEWPEDAMTVAEYLAIPATIVTTYVFNRLAPRRKN